MNFVIARKGSFHQEKLAKTTARRKKNAAQVALNSLTANTPVNDMMPGIIITWRKPNDLKAPSRKVRKTQDKHLAETVRSIAHFGFVSPIIISGDCVVDGYTRLLAARALDMPEVPCIDVSHLSAEKVRLLTLALNRLAETGSWDQDELKLELGELEIAEMDLTFSGFTLPEIDIIMGPDAKDEDEEESIPEPPLHPVSVLGDLWHLGDHRVLCGNAQVAGDYASLMGDAEAAAMLTDPPYNVKIAGNVSGLGKVKHGEFQMGVGEFTPDEFQKFLATPLQLSKAYLLAGAVIYAFMDWRSIDILMAAARTCGFKHINTAVWHKGSGGMGALLRSAHEFVGVFCHGDTPRVNNVELGKHGRDRTNVWIYPGANKPGSSGAKALKDHPTPKNVEMCADALLDVTRRDEIVIDPFLGSGTTLIAAERTARICYGMELEPRFVDVIVRRWEELTGKPAVHAASGLTFSEVRNERAAAE